MISKDTAGMYELVGIGELAETVTQLLLLNLQRRDERPSNASAVEHYLLQQARDHLGSVREGFVLSLRTSQIGDPRELRFLLDRVLLDWSRLSEELGAEEESSASADGPASDGEAGDKIEGKIERLHSQMLAFSMAAIALGHLPRLPAEQITFPKSYGTPPTYADIPVPRTPAEMLGRIDELETTLWQLMARDPQEMVDHHYGRVRRTYGFFESSARLTRREAIRFGIKKPPSDVRW